MNPPEPQPARRRGRKNRAFHDLLAGLAAAACVLAFMLFSSRVGTAAASGETTPSSPPPAASANSASESEQPGVDPETASPQTGQEETPWPEELPWNLRLVNKDNPLPRDFSVETAEAAEGQLDSRAASALSQMVSDMEAPGPFSRGLLLLPHLGGAGGPSSKQSEPAFVPGLFPGFRRGRGLSLGGARGNQRTPARFSGRHCGGGLPGSGGRAGKHPRAAMADGPLPRIWLYPPATHGTSRA